MKLGTAPSLGKLGAPAENTDTMPEDTYTATTPENGRVEFQNIPFGEYTVTLTHDDYETLVSEGERLDEDGRAPIYEMVEREEPVETVPPEVQRATFVVNAVTENGEWLEDGIEGVDIELQRTADATDE